MAGLKELSAIGELRNSYEFLGKLSEDRNKATGEICVSNNLRLKIRSSLNNIFTKCGLKHFFSRNIRLAKNKISDFDLIVLQGFQDVFLAKHANKIGKCLVYMPHSPSVVADEYKMLCELNGTEFNRNNYQKLLRDEAYLIANSNFIVFPSRGAGTSYFTEFAADLSEKKIFYIKSGAKINLSGACGNFTRKSVGPIRILFAGRYVSHKGYDLFCKAASLIGVSLGDIEFVTVGDGPMKKNYPYVTDMGWRNDVFNVLFDADIIVVPNRIAYYDLLPLECAAIGKPLVMTAVGGNVDQLRDLPDSLSCGGESPADLADSIRAAVKRLRAEPTWGFNNKVAFESIFTIGEFAKRWDDAVEQMVREN